MNAPTELLSHQMQVMKDLYAEFFLLMLMSVEEEPGEPGTGVIDGTIEALMGRIDEEMRGFRERMAISRGERLLPEKLDAEMQEFETGLRDGLQGMLRRLESRRQQLTTQMSEMKDRLKLVQRKRTGARGYQRGIGNGQLMDSQV